MTSSSEGGRADAFGGVVQRLAGLLGAIPGELIASYPVWEVDENLVYTYVSARAAELLGRPAGAIVGRMPFELMPVDEAQRARAALDELRAAQKSFSGRILRYQKPGGAIVVVETSGMPLFRPDGTFRGFRCTDRDVPPSGHSLDGRLAQLEAIFATTPAAQGLIDRHGRFLAANEALAALCDRPVADVVHQRVEALLPPAVQSLAADLARFEQGEAMASHEFAWQGGVYLALIRPVRDRRQQVTGVLMALTAITEQKRTEEKLAELNSRLRTYATYDHLTGIPNRRFFDAMLVSEMRRARRNAAPLSLILFDVDHFKRYNDCYGHPAGDVCLHQVAKAASECLLKPTDTVCRYGGEEFAALLPATDVPGALLAAERVREAVVALRLPHQSGVDGYVTVSLGVASLQPGIDLADLEAERAALLARADKALYAAKAAGRNTACGWGSDA